MAAPEERTSQVAAWLKKIFGDHPIPQYEVNPRTTEILYHLSERNRVRDRNISLVIEDLKQKASEYESEAKHLQDFLMESVNFSPANLSNTGSRFLNALVDSAIALETKDTSLASFIPAVNDLTSDLFRTKSKNEEIKLELEKLGKNLTATLVLEKCLREAFRRSLFFFQSSYWPPGGWFQSLASSERSVMPSEGGGDVPEQTEALKTERAPSSGVLVLFPFKGAPNQGVTLQRWNFGHLKRVGSRVPWRTVSPADGALAASPAPFPSRNLNKTLVRVLETSGSRTGGVGSRGKVAKEGSWYSVGVTLRFGYRELPSERLREW
ncbi:hypothetical protein STEG23_003770, partial [Scotinomys teguina]